MENSSLTMCIMLSMALVLEGLIFRISFLTRSKVSLV